MTKLEDFCLNFWLKYPRIIQLAVFLLAVFSVLAIAIRTDEAWIGETVFWYSKEGVVSSDLWEGYYFADVKIVAHHYLFVRSSAFLLNFLPWHIYSLRVLTLAGGLACAALVVYFARKQYKFSRPLAGATGALFLLFPFTFEYLSFYRPELLVSLFGFGSFWCLYRHPDKLKWILFAGILAGVSMLLHLSGFIYFCAGGSYLLLKKRFSYTLLFGLAGLLTFLPFLIEIVNNIDLFWYQLTSPMNTAGKNLKWYGPLVNLINEQKRIFRGPHTIVVSVLTLISIYFLYKKRILDLNLLLYLAMLILFFGLMSTSKTSRYNILYYPFIALIIASAFQISPESKKSVSKWLQPVYAFALAGFSAFSVAWAVYLPVSEMENTTAINRELYTSIPAGAKCAVPMSFIFDGLETYKLYALKAMYANDTDGYQVSELIERSGKMEIEYLVLNKTWRGRIMDFEQRQDLFQLNFSKIKTVDHYELYKFLPAGQR